MKDEGGIAELSEMEEKKGDDDAGKENLGQKSEKHKEKILDKILEIHSPEKMTVPVWKHALEVMCRILKIPEEKEQFLQGCREEELDVWCRGVYEGVPLAELKGMRGKEWTEGEIKARILQHIKQRIPLSEGVYQKILELQQQARDALADYAYIRDTYLQEITESRKQERDAQQHVLEAKDETICIQKERITELEGKIRNLKRGKNQAEPAKKENTKPSFLEHFKKGRKSVEIIRFREMYLDDPDYSSEQKEFLLNCFEENLSFEELARFASPALTVEQMSRLRRIYEKRYRT